MMPGKQSILVTGAAGFIGSFVAARLAALGHRVCGCDNFNDYYDPGLKTARVRAKLAPFDVQCHTAELADPAQVAALFERVAPTLVVHLAAQSGVRHSLGAPGAYVQSNLVAFGHLLEACRKHRIAHLLYASSSSVYGGNAKVPFSEDDPTDEPVSLYAATKKANELMAHALQPPVPAAGHRRAAVYRVRAVGAAGHGVLPLHRKNAQGRTDPGVRPGPAAARLHLLSTISSKAWCSCCSSRAPTRTARRTGWSTSAPSGRSK